MKLRRKRPLRAEQLENRQLLAADMIGPAPDVGARVEAVFARADQNEDGQIDKSEVSERAWNRLARADGDDENTTVSAEELTAHLEGVLEEHNERRQQKRKHRAQHNAHQHRHDMGDDRPTIKDRVAKMMQLDSNENGVLDADDGISERRWKILTTKVDADKNGEVTPDELTATFEDREGERPRHHHHRHTHGRRSGPRGQHNTHRHRHDMGDDRPTIEDRVGKMMKLDSNENGVLDVDDGISERRWKILTTKVDADENGEVTPDELTATFEDREGERPRHHHHRHTNVRRAGPRGDGERLTIK